MASMAAHTSISDLLSMSMRRFYLVSGAILSVMEKRNR